jgi:hypothetical protein
LLLAFAAFVGGSGGVREAVILEKNIKVDSSEGKDRETLPEMRVWQAVLTSTVDEWVNGPLRRKREAEEYLFSDSKDYRMVCESAGMDPDHLRLRLQQLGKREGLPGQGGWNARRRQCADFSAPASRPNARESKASDAGRCDAK